MYDDHLPALGNKNSSEIVAENLNDHARQNYIKSEASPETKQTVKHQKSTCSDIIFKTSDKVYYKRKDN